MHSYLQFWHWFHSLVIISLHCFLPYFRKIFPYILLLHFFPKAKQFLLWNGCHVFARFRHSFDSFRLGKFTLVCCWLFEWQKPTVFWTLFLFNWKVLFFLFLVLYSHFHISYHLQYFSCFSCFAEQMMLYFFVWEVSYDCFFSLWNRNSPLFFWECGRNALHFPFLPETRDTYWRWCCGFSWMLLSSLSAIRLWSYRLPPRAVLCGLNGVHKKEKHLWS